MSFTDKIISYGGRALIMSPAFAAFGYGLGKICEQDPALTATAFVVTGVVTDIFEKLSCRCLRVEKLASYIGNFEDSLWDISDLEYYFNENKPKIIRGIFNRVIEVVIAVSAAIFMQKFEIFTPYYYAAPVLYVSYITADQLLNGFIWTCEKILEE